MSDKKKAKKRLLFLNKQISSYGQRKQVAKALECYKQVVEVEGIKASAYTYTSLINAHVRSGDVDGAKAIAAPLFLDSVALDSLQLLSATPGMARHNVRVRCGSERGSIHGAAQRPLCCG